MVKYKNRGPVDYSLCNQVVTVFHLDGTTVTKMTALAFFDFRKNDNVNRTGQTETNSFLLVIPSVLNSITEQPVFNGDKVLLGTDETELTMDYWRSLIPAKVPNLAVVKYVDPKYWQGEITHWEAGG